MKAGLKRFFTGKPCLHGHVAERMVSSKGCIECSKIGTAAWVRENREKRNAYNREWRKANPDKAAGYSAASRSKRPTGDASARVKEWRASNPDQAKFHSLFYTNKRNAAILKRTPLWADFDEIKQIYLDACEFRAAGLEVDVDHIIPLQGRLVSGLHVHQNLRVCLSSVNRKKSNSFNI